MNQILYTTENKGNGPLPIKKVVQFFGISMIILGIIFLGEGTYSLISYKTPGPVIIDTSVPEIKFAKDGNDASIAITHSTGISMVKYAWNDGDQTIVKGYSEKEVVVSSVSIPAGTNTLNVEVIDDNSVSSKSSYEYTYDGIAIDLAVVNNSHIKIIASDAIGMSYMKYRWNADEEITVYPNSEGDLSIEHLTEIPSGLNTLYITAVNTSNITLDKEQNVKGVKGPEIEYYIIGTDLCVIVRDDEGVDTITQKINDEEEKVFKADGQKVYMYRYYIGDRKISLTLTATDVDGASKTVTGEN